ncbi:MAG: ATP-binding cassette domain-containing protein [Lactobacillales bacterium]|jgi:D-methionine transport system ATP-binding protein|nr:ATP-binding cassette domain-containing protein [Lactobacillales bacterium]
MSIIELKEITKIFAGQSENIKALDKVTLKIKKGDIYGIIGYSGAGKSTLVRLFNGLETASSGTLKILGKEISKLRFQDLREFRQKIGMIFQHFNLLWSKTVLENVELPLKFAKISKVKRKQRAKELINLVGLTGRDDYYPNQLSGGQKQRVGIARSLANNPEVLLSDESTSALDPQTTDEILDLLLDLNRKLGLTIVLITHEMHVIRRIASKVAVMEKGAVIEQGAVVELFNQPKTETTRKFVQQDIDPRSEDTSEFVMKVLQKDPKACLAELIFNGNVGSKPILTKIIRKFRVDINVLHGNLKHTNTGILGMLSVILTGEEVEQTITFLKSLDVGVEVNSFDKQA